MPYDIMSNSPTYFDIGVRIALTVFFGSLIGLNRQAGGHAAGFRTTLLVGLAACLAMIQANLLLEVTGKTSDSFSVMDTLRLPLGILTGVGFIGGGAILKRGDLLTGVTTAATMWIITTIGLCFGGGQLIIGSVAAIIALVILSPLKVLDHILPKKQKALVTLEVAANQRAPNIDSKLKELGCVARYLSQERGNAGKTTIVYELRWKGTSRDLTALDILAELEQTFAVSRFEVVNPTA